jgi:hypothetical protein
LVRILSDCTAEAFVNNRDGAFEILGQ